MPILVLRIAQLHVNKRSNPSPFHTFKRSIGSFSTYTSVLTYIVSSVVFTALYLLSCRPSEQLGIVIEGKSYERPRLNERFIYLLFFSGYIGVVQGIQHVASDRARLVFPEDTVPTKDAFLKQFPPALWNSGVVVSISTVTAAFVYLFFRPMLWANTLWIARQFYWLNRSTTLPPFPVGPGLFIRSGVIAFMTAWLAEISHLAFTVYFVENPFLDNKSITDKSPDPNGTLVSGLRMTRAPLTQLIAFWELNHIASTRVDRRRMIFSDTRSPVIVWEQILNECLRTLNDVEIKLAEINTPSSPEPASSASASPNTPASPHTPSIPVSQNNVLVTTGKPSPGRELLQKVQSPDGSSPSSSLRKHFAMLPSPPVNLDIAQTQASVGSRIKDQLSPIVASKYGKPFRFRVEKTASAAVPNVQIQVDAVSALSRLVVASLEEDEFGKVQTHVVRILQSFIAMQETLEGFLKSPPLHWSDTDASRSLKSGGSVRLEEPEVLVKALKEAVADITRAFSKYFETLKLPLELKRKLPGVM